MNTGLAGSSGAPASAEEGVFTFALAEELRLRPDALASSATSGDEPLLFSGWAWLGKEPVEALKTETACGETGNRKETDVKQTSRECMERGNTIDVHAGEHL